MNRTALRTLVLLAVLSVVGIIVTQLYWVKKSLNLQDDQFNHRVHVALNTVANKLITNTHGFIELEELNRVSHNYYTLDFSSPVQIKLLEDYLLTEFKNQYLYEPFEYGFFNCDTDTLIFGKYIYSIDNQNVERLNIEFPRESNFYIGVLFPRKKSYFTDDWTILAVFSIMLIIVLLFFSFSIMTILKQKQIGEIKNDFVNNMTHEFKTPISTIGLAADVLKRENITSYPERVNHYARIISEENKRLKSQVENVLQIALTDANKISLKEEALDMHEIIALSVQNLEVRAIERGGYIKTQLDAIYTELIGDKVHITNIMHNLLDNALKYSEEVPKIQVITKNRGQYLDIFIEDKGVGIASNDLPLLFEKFYRVGSGDRHDVKGFGIGLFYVKNIVKLHRGNISVKSKLGQGSTFHITLPIKK